MPDKLGDKTRLAHILNAAETVERYLHSAPGPEGFRPDTLLFDAVVRQLSIIGEAANHLSERIYRNHARVPWAQIVALRNLVMHEYFGVDALLIWKIAQQDLPALKAQVEEIFGELEPEKFE